MNEYLTAEEILYIHYKVVEDFGGLHGLRDEIRLASVVDAPRQEVFGVQQYESVHDKAAVYMRNIIGDHPFLDGNKRTGITVAAIFLNRHGIQLTAAPIELEDFAVQVAVESLDVPAIATWLNAHSEQKNLR